MKNFTLITGASSGIGRQLAFVLANKNKNLLLVARREELLKELAEHLLKEYEASILYFACDITNDTELSSLYQFISSQDLTISTLINNAGIGDFSLFEKSSPQKNKYIINLNISAVLNLCSHFIPQMTQAKKGGILNVASMAAFMPSPYIAVYASAKSFILNYSLALAAELEEHNIQVSVLCPGDIKTEFQKNANLEKFEVNSKISLPELALYAYTQFFEEKETIIIPPETKKHIEMMSRSGTPLSISRNLYKMRKLLSKKLGLSS